MSLVVAVRALCEFTAKTGDLDLRFTPSPTAQQGIAGHALVAARRGADYLRELPLQGRHGELTVRGRADGYDALARRLDEVKTYRGDLARVPDNHRQLHWAQLKTYGALLCRERSLPAVELSLVYFDVVHQRETRFSERHAASELQAFFERQCERFIAWARQEAAHRDALDAGLAALAFPHREFRAGQRELAAGVYRAAKAGRCLLAQAPTGIGKTIGTIFPALKAMPGERLDRLFFLTAKESGRRLALDALQALRQGAAPPLRVLELTAREKACVHPDKACHGASCPLAQGFYDRLDAARQTAVDTQTLDRATLHDVALRHAVCPYYLAQEMVRWADVVIGDYNHYFDAVALLHAAADESRVGVLVDEAHNLVERARAMYSAELDEAELRRLRRNAPAALQRPLQRLQRAWSALRREQPAPYRVLPALPRRFADALQHLIATIGDVCEADDGGADPVLRQFHFDALRFARLLESFGDHSMIDLTLLAPKHARVSLRNLVPAPFLQPRFAAAHTTTLFSATLAPAHFHRHLLGLPDDTVWLDVASPYDARQLTVQIAGHVSTRYRDRAASLAPLVDLLAERYAAQPGNYLAFFSSFEYLQAAAERLAQRHPGVPHWCQTSGMDATAREAFLARFTPDGRGVGFAVLGGSFGEAIDLPGTRLIGAFIATLGLPPVNPVNEQMRARLAARFGAGYDYAYLYPGLQKVVQAAGRVIRSPQDRGVVVLIDDRFERRSVRQWLPRWWDVQPHPHPARAGRPAAPPGTTSAGE